MAATVALLGTPVFNTTAGNKTITATPTVGDLIVVIAVATGATSTVADNQSGTYTQVGSTQTGFSTSGNLQMFVRNSLVTSSVSTVYTATQTSSTGGGLIVLRVTGMSLTGSAAVRSNGGQSTGTAGTTPAPVLSLTPLTKNPIITAVASANTVAGSVMVQRTGYTEDFDNIYSTPATALESAHLNSGETSATLTQGGTSTTAFASLAIELSIDIAINVSDASTVTDAGWAGILATSAISAITEDWSSGTIGANWTISNAHAVVTSQRLVMTTQASSTNYFDVYTVNPHNLISDQATVQLVSVGSQSLASYETIFWVGKEATTNGNRYYFDVNANTLAARKIINGSASILITSTAYNSTNHQWLRIRESNVTVFFDTSADGITWTNLTSVTAEFALTNVYVSHQVGTFSSEVSAASSTFDNFNILPSTDASINVFDSSTATDVIVTLYIDPLSINVFDASTVSDVPTVIPQIPGLSLFDSSTVTDSITQILLTSNINVFDASTVSNVIIQILVTGNINVFDASTVTDVLMQILLQSNISVFDTSTVTDVLSKILTIDNVNVFDSSAVTDAPTVQIPTYYINTSDASNVTDSLLQILDQEGVVVFDTTTVTDTPTVVPQIPGLSLFDSSTTTDVITQILTTSNINVFDSSTVTDVPTVTMPAAPGVDIVISAGEDTAVTDVLTVQIPVYFVSVADSSGVTEAITVIPQIPGLSLFDASTVTDVPIMLLISNVVTQEASTVTDAVTMLSISNIVISDASTVTDVPTVRLLTNISVFDSSTVTDTVIMAGTSFITVNDVSTATDSLIVSVPTYFIAVSESSTVSESIQTTGTIRLSVFDTSTVTDVPIVHLLDNSLLGISVFDSVGSPYPFIFVDGRMAIRLGGNQYTFL